jgi:hypothetical protein
MDSLLFTLSIHIYLRISYLLLRALCRFYLILSDLIILLFGAEC